MSNTELVSSPAKAIVANYKLPRSFSIRFGIGVLRSIRDFHAGFNEFLWKEVDHNGPPGFVIALFGTLLTGGLAACVAGVVSACTALTFGALMTSWPAITFALLPAEFIASNIVINFVASIPKMIIGSFRLIAELVTFIKNEVEKRIPDE